MIGAMNEMKSVHQMTKSLNKWFFILLSFFCGISQSTSAENELQKALDKLATSGESHRANGTVTDFDLSPYTEPLTETLYIRNGINVRFVNGSIVGDKVLPGSSPLIEIIDNSRLDLSASAKLLANKSSYAEAVVKIGNGELVVSGGTINGMHNDETTVNSVPRRTKSDSYTIPGGLPIEISINPFAVHISAHSGSILTVTSGSIIGFIKNEGKNSLFLTGGTIDGEVQSPSADVVIGGNIIVKNIGISKDSQVALVSAIANELPIKGIISDGQTVIYGKEYTISYSDLNKIWLMDDYKPTIQTASNTISAAEWGKNRLVEYLAPGHLAYMSYNNQEITESLFLAGKVNGSDIAMIREIGNKALKKLDLSHASIVSGGRNYFEQQAPGRPGFIGGVFTFLRYYTENDTISYHMFGDLEKLESIALPAGCRIIEEEAFINCNNLQKMTYTESITDIAGSAFIGCSSLTDFNLNYNSTLMLDNGVVYDKAKTKAYAALPAMVTGDVTFPSSIQTINKQSFFGCTRLNSISLEASGIKTIHASTFNSCSSLSKLHLPRVVEIIGDNAFKDCAITSLTLPEAVQKIGIGAFCNNPITEIHSNSSIPPSIQPFMPHDIDIYLRYSQNGTFEGVDTLTCKVYVPKGCISAYKMAEGWKSFKFIIEENDPLPTTGCDEDWLQKKLDEIAAQKPSEPVELTICEDGITLTKNILVDWDCKAVLTGGPITSEASIVYRHGGEGVFMVYGELGFHDISLTFNNDAKNDGSHGYFWLGDGTLKMQENTVVNTTNGTVIGGWGQYELKSGTVTAGGNEMVIDSGIEADISGSVKFVGAQTYCNGRLSLDITFSEAGYVQIPSFRVNDIYVTSTLDIYAPLSTLPVYLYKDATINTEEGGIAVLTVAGEWDKMTPGRAIVTSTSITQKDYEGMTFDNLPTNLKAEFVPEMHQVQLVTVEERNIQNDLDGLMTGDQTTPIVIDVASDAVSMLSQPATVSHANVTFNGMQDGSASRGRLHFAKDQALTVSQGSLVTLTNLDVTGEGGSECFLVKGQLVIGENVHVSGFTCFLCVQNGGSVGVSGPLVSTVTLRYVNGLTDGQTLIVGTDGYQLTEQDLSCVLVEDCELKLDMANNRIVAVNPTSIHEIEKSSLEMAGDYYDLSGRHVLAPRQGVYIMKSEGKTRKVYVK